MRAPAAFNQVRLAYVSFLALSCRVGEPDTPAFLFPLKISLFRSSRKHLLSWEGFSRDAAELICTVNRCRLGYIKLHGDSIQYLRMSRVP